LTACGHRRRTPATWRCNDADRAIAADTAHRHRGSSISSLCATSQYVTASKAGGTATGGGRSRLIGHLRRFASATPRRVPTDRLYSPCVGERCTVVPTARLGGRFETVHEGGCHISHDFPAT